MSYSTAADALIRYRLLEEIVGKMTDDEKHILLQQKQGSDFRAIMEAIGKQNEQLNRIEKSQNWAVDFGSDVAANFLTDGLIWLGSRLFRKL